MRHFEHKRWGIIAVFPLRNITSIHQYTRSTYLWNTTFNDIFAVLFQAKISAMKDIPVQSSLTYPEYSLIQILFGNQFTFLTINWFTYTDIWNEGVRIKAAPLYGYFCCQFYNSKNSPLSQCLWSSIVLLVNELW